MAAKTYYFGIGGGLLQFTEEAKAVGFQVERLCVINDGASNMREIIMLQKKKLDIQN